MKAETQVRVRQVQKFSRVARWLCSGFLAFVAAFSVWAMYSIVSGSSGTSFRFVLGRISFTGPQIDSLALKTWLTFLLGAGLYITVRMLWLLHALFGKLALGELYTPGNVRRLRSLGWLMLGAACLNAVAPLITTVLLASRIIEWPQATTHGETWTFNAASFSGFAIAGIVILVSWIMDVGLDAQDEADTLRREAELVI